MRRQVLFLRPSLAAAAFLLAGCPDPAATVDDGLSDGSSGGDGPAPGLTTTGEPPGDASTGGGSSGDESTGNDDDDTSGDTTGNDDDGTTGEMNVCGNEVQEGDEVCDGAALGGETCLTQGFAAGVLSCAEDCQGFDVDGCSDAPACIEDDLGSALGMNVLSGSTVGADDDLEQTCGLGGGPDNVVFWVAPEAGTYAFDTFGSEFDTTLAAYSSCDAADELACNDDAGSLQSRIVVFADALEPLVISISGFDGGTGNYVLNIDEIDLDGPCCGTDDTPGCAEDACAADVCSVNPQCCSDAWGPGCVELAATMCDVCNTDDICGNGALDGMGEVCDGDDAGAETCQSQGFDGGTLGCTDDCSALDASSCVDFDGDCCAGNDTPGCEDLTCADTVCETDPFCCEVSWFGGVCAAVAQEVCEVCQVCGDDEAVQGEACDGMDLLGESCESQGFLAGTLGCQADCAGFDTSSCVTNGGGDCCADNGSPGCDDDLCVQSICDSSPQCCDTAWDQSCADLAAVQCTTCGGEFPWSNGSFETGDFTGWATQDLGLGLLSLTVGGAGPGTFPPFFDFAPVDGSFSAQHGWDGNGATGPHNEIVVGQFVTVSAAATTATLSFDHRLAWQLTFGATLDREFLVRISDGLGTPLDSVLIETAVAGTNIPDNGTQTETIDLTPYIGQTIEIEFVWTVPEDSTGPGQAELDNVALSYG